MITKKQKTKDDDRDQENSGKIKMIDTTTTIGTESQTEQSIRDRKNGEDSKQNHDVQKGSDSPQLH